MHTKTNRVYALKMLQKTLIEQLKQQANIINEKELLFRINHPFIIKLFDTYQDKDRRARARYVCTQRPSRASPPPPLPPPSRLYMLMEAVQGGELFSRLQSSSTPGYISSSEACFYTSCVLDAFDYLHSRSIVYRDLKPENLLIDAAGYLKIVDFGFAKVVKDRTFTLCGTPEYLAPELVMGQGHNKGADYWALGVLLYEQASGYSPFADHNDADQMVICRNIIAGKFEWPNHVRDKDLKDLVGRLLTKEIAKRLGCLRGGAADVKAHKFFSSIVWADLRSLKVQAPWKPKLSGSTDTSYFNDYDEHDTVEPYTRDANGWADSF
jgi:serine/threonine protein kinase